MKQQVIVLSHRGIFIFDSDITNLSTSFSPKQELQKFDKDISVGVIVSPYSIASEIWVTSQRAKVLYVLEMESFTVVGKVPFVSGDVGTNIVRHMVTIEALDSAYLAMACKHIIYMINTRERKQLEHQFNCQQICAEGVEGTSK